MFFSRQLHNNIDFLRALAVVSVFIHHAQQVFGGSFPFLGEYGGQFGPQLFFLISGYLIYSSCAKYSLRDYAIHRAFRIFPAYWFYLLFFGILTSGITVGKLLAQPLWLVANLTLLQQLFPSALLYFDVLHVTWTLTVELLWYISVPLIFFLFKKISIRVLVASVVFSTLFIIAASMGHFDFVYAEVQKTPSMRYLFIENSYPAQFCFFIFGAFIYSNQDFLKTKFSALASVNLFVLIFLLKPYYLLVNPLFITGLGLSFFMLACIHSPPLKSRFIFYISEISFSIYLCHFPVILWVRHSLQLTGFVGLITAVGATLTLAAVSYWAIERPGMNIGRRLARSTAWSRRRVRQAHLPPGAASVLLLLSGASQLPTAQNSAVVLATASGSAVRPGR